LQAATLEGGSAHLTSRATIEEPPVCVTMMKGSIDLQGNPIIRFRLLLVVGILSAGALRGRAQTTLSSLTANNTAACPAVGKLPAHCQKPFAGQMDTRQQVATPQFDPPAGNVSGEDPHSYLTQGASTKIFANIMAGFCTSSTETNCHNNVQTGYTANDGRTVAAQVEDIRARHLDGAIISWEGPGTVEDATTLKLQSYIDSKHCRGPQDCDPMYMIMIDGPSIGYTVTATGIPGTTGASCSGRTGADYENCVVAHLRNDMCSMNGRHWGNDAYQKVNGRPVVLVFPDDAVIPAVGPAPSWVDVWVHVQDWNSNLPGHCGKAPYDADNGVPLIVFENRAGFSHSASAGAYYWLKPQGTDPLADQFVSNIEPDSAESTLDSFYQTALKHPTAVVWGGAFKGFNSARSAWGTNRIMDQRCGQIWIQSLTESNKYYKDTPLPFLQIATWNDYNEGTEIEAGIDNCYTVSAQIAEENLTWALDSSNANASLSTVSRIEVYDSRNGRDLNLLASLPPAVTGSYRLDELPSGKHRIYVRMVGKNSILNRMSAPVPFSR